jgi:hypothetical protein
MVRPVDCTDSSVGEYMGAMQMYHRMYRLSVLIGGGNEKVGI